MSEDTAQGAGQPPRRVVVRRTGGLAGFRTEGYVDLDGSDVRGIEIGQLVDRVDLAGLPDGSPQPDRYVYEFDLCGEQATVFEQHLTADLRRIADLVLGDGRTGPREPSWR